MKTIDRPDRPCHFVPDLGHVLRTHLADCVSAGCDGCAPCPERHCSRCGREHVTVEGRGADITCARCIGGVREDMAEIERRSEKLLTEAVHRGINSEAANLAGPVPPTLEAIEAHRWRQLSAFWGRIPELPEDDQHPAWVLGSWELLVREHLGQPTEGRVLLATARRYLDGHLTRLAQDDAFPFEELAREVRSCLTHLEAVVHDSRRRQQGAPCPMCGQARLEMWHADCQCDDGAPAAVCSGVCAEDDVWWCPRCGAEYAPSDYRDKVGMLAPLVADRLTARQMAEVYRVPEGSVRGWASRGKVRRRGHDGQGRMLYDVADVLAQRDGHAGHASRDAP